MNDAIVRTPVSELYFSKTNMNNVHNAIRFLVWKYTTKVIGAQSQTNLYLAMRNIYEYTNLPEYYKNEKKMVSILNRRLVYSAVKNILHNMDSQMSYLDMKDQWSEHKLEQPIYVSPKGLKSRPVNNFL